MARPRTHSVMTQLEAPLYEWVYARSQSEGLSMGRFIRDIVMRLREQTEPSPYNPPPREVREQ